MAFIEYINEEPKNFQQKCLCVLLLDVSGSMADPDKKPRPIDELNKGIKIFHEQISEDNISSKRLEISVISFNHNVTCEQEPSLVANFEMPTLNASGMTNMADAINMAMTKVEQRKTWYKKTGQPYYRPWIILITDGEPDAGQDIISVAKKLQEGKNEKQFVFFAVGVEGADMNVLKKISPHKEGKLSPRKLDGLKFAEFFEWLSSSFAETSRSSTDADEEDNSSFYETETWEGKIIN